MGIGIGKPSCRSSYEYSPRCKITPNPNPYRFSVVTEEYHNPYLIAAVKYHDCTVYNGIKIMVFKNLKTLQDVIHLDPHFLDGKHSSLEPIARFPGNTTGAELAQLFVQGLLQHDNPV